MKNYPQTNADKALARFILVIFLILFTGFYSFLAIPVAYSKKILPQISVAGINLGGKDINRAKSLLEFEAQHFDKINITLKYGKKRFNPTLADLGISVDIDKTIEKAYSLGHNGNLFNDLKTHILSFSNPQEVMYEINIDETKYNRYFRKLAKYVKRSPVNASLQIEGTQVKYIAGKDGLTLTSDKTKSQIVESLRQGKIKTFTLKTKKNPPYIQKPETENAKKQAEKWMKASVIVTVKYDQKAEQTSADKTFTASGATVGSWIYFKEGDEELKAKLSNSAISGWAQSIASQGTISAINKRIQIVENKQKTLSKGKEGQAPNVSGIAPKIAKAIQAGGGLITIKTTKLEPQEEVIGGFLLGRFDGKYIEIVLSQQKLYAIKGKTLKYTFTVSSGRVDKPTPLGHFKVLRKTTWAKCAPSPTEYTTCYMPYSMFFTNQGHAIHALPIIDNVQEGMWHLGYKVSHGCVRVAPDAAITLYNWAPEGTPVIIHY